MRLLILGGTVFLGRAVARHAVDAGHHVTCLARGDSGPPVAGTRFLTADRDQTEALSLLDAERFDAVVDVTRRPSHARRAVQALADRIEHWVYVSSISVYSDTATPGQHADTAPLLPPAGPEVDDPGVDPAVYGPCKVSCEQAVLEGVGPQRAMLCRVGLIAGPEDLSGRFNYWVTRLAHGGRVLAPGRPEDLVQLVDVRDLAAWLVAAAEQRLAGAYNASSAPVPLGELLAQVAAGVGTEPQLEWVAEEFLLEHEVRPWWGERSLPLWLPHPEYSGLMSHDTSPALAAGLTIRPFAQTAAATREWLRSEAAPVKAAGLSPEEEAELLRAWDAAAGAGSAPADRAGSAPA